MTAIMGVDPGVNGAFSILDTAGKILYSKSFKPSMKLTEAVDALRIGVGVLKANPPGVCIMEKVSYIRGDGAQGSFTFGDINGTIKGALVMAGVIPVFVTPMVWQATLDCLTGGNKNVTKNLALKLFSSQILRITHSNADSLLIAEYGRRRLLSAAQTKDRAT